MRCLGRSAELDVARASFVRNAPPLRVPARRTNLRRLPVMARMATALGLAAALVLFVALRKHDEGTRSKGGSATLGFYVSHGGAVRLGGPDERVRPGDALRFVVSAREEAYLAVLSVDGQHHASTYYPSKSEAALVGNAQNLALDQSTILDETLGDETLYGVFCKRPFAVEPLRLALEAHPAQPPAPDGCTVDTLHVRKEPASAP